MAAHAHTLVLDLALTIRHDGHGGVADDLQDAAGLTGWVRERADDLVDEMPGARDFTADGDALAAVLELRAAVRSLFARAVRPGLPSSADAQRLLPADRALGRLNSAAADVPVVPRLDWPETGEPTAVSRPAGAAGECAALTAALARAAIAFLAGPGRARLRACHAPRCVRYFLKEHPRQEWCKPVCGNRARVARHHERHRSA
ncbi:CGNR zinc finger domain-containing protein [Streptomyces sp. NBC_01142]|uniref:CGNR zinc finger domain-containing protein n=1 Tax=Streptomyces sp. NBC_01142 TaxID=2975865 RepID=UPI0022548118|nr:CGNR zinc finger domain-containing protein [Streptomyces sp. NBC_01142]MCX4825431.1 CGNR zinc finger domain-containing protein [Streptomyces sp. NBC_01142]